MPLKEITMREREENIVSSLFNLHKSHNNRSYDNNKFQQHSTTWKAHDLLSCSASQSLLKDARAPRH